MSARFTDADILEILHMKEALGMTTRQIGRRYGVTKNSIIGLTGRVLRAVAPDERHDGTMPVRWWEEGLQRRGGANDRP